MILLFPWAKLLNKKTKAKGWKKKKPTTTDKNPNFYQHEDKIP